ncbi:hypothetical protein HUW35_14020 [Microbulbifer sp. YPW1]|nr:hypothetical protein HUW35_14020 [Microbulbifer sp. YPW1]
MKTFHRSKAAPSQSLTQKCKFLPLKAAMMTSLIALCSTSVSAKTHPSYLTESYCDGLVEQFVDSGMRSLGKYVNENFKPEYKGGIRNTINFLNQRAEWLGECDEYLNDTANSRIFYDDKNTKAIFDAMKELAKELQLVREGVEYPDESGTNNPRPFIKSRYETLATLVDQHHTRLLMKKQFQ